MIKSLILYRKAPNTDFKTPYLLDLLDEQLLSSSTSKALQIAVCPHFKLVGEEDWRKFWWNAFYQTCLSPLPDNGVKYVVQAENDWDNSLVESQLNEVLTKVENFGFGIENLENFKLMLHRFSFEFLSFCGEIKGF